MLAALIARKPPIANGYIKYEWIEVSRNVKVVSCVRTQHLPTSRVSAAVEGDWAEFSQLSQQVLKTVEVVLMQDAALLSSMIRSSCSLVRRRLLNLQDPSKIEFFCRRSVSLYSR